MEVVVEMTDPLQAGRIGVILGHETTPLMQQLVGRLELSSSLSGDDNLAIVTALQKAFIAGAQTAQREPTIHDWKLPWGDQWARDHGQEGAEG
jgi:hypothetical protein